MVNAANRWLSGGGGVDGAIHRAGGPSIIRECMAITARRGQVQPGQVVATGAGSLKAAHVLHAVGPRWDGASPESADAALASCYSTSLDLALGLGARTIAFPSISTGVYKFPADRATSLAVDTVKRWVTDHPGVLDSVTFVCFDTETLDLYRPLIHDLSTGEPPPQCGHAGSGGLSERPVRRGWWSRRRKGK